MNIRSLTRGDGAVIGAAVLLLIASFLTMYSTDYGEADFTVNAWESGLFPILSSVHLLGLIAAGLIAGSRFLPEGRKLLGIQLDHWGTVFAVTVAWSALWSMFRAGDGLELGLGAFLSLLFGLVLAAAAVLSGVLPALKAPLLPAPRPPAPQGYQQPGVPGMQQPGGYGYPGVGGAPAPESSYGGQAGYPGRPQPAGQHQPYGASQPQPGMPQPGMPQPGMQQPAQQQEQPQPGASDFTAFWFAVPVARPLFGEDGSPAPIAELTPGTWYLAVDQRGPALVAQTQDGRRGVLQDTTGIQRG